MVSKYAGQLAGFVNEWCTVTENSFVRETVRGYKIIFSETPLQTIEPCQASGTALETEVVDGLVCRLITIGAIVEANNVSGQFISKIFAVPKATGGHRLVINLKPLNKYIENDHFKMEDWRTAAKLLDNGAFMGKVDLTDAYHMISIHPESRKFLRFRWQGKLYEYVCLPFGLSSAPYVFTKIMKEAFKPLRQQDLVSVIYLDDALLYGKTRDLCKINIDVTIQHLKRLGFVISQKSDLNPKQEMEFLGLVFNSIRMDISLPERKKKGLLKVGTKLMTESCVSIRYLAEFIGSLVAATPGVKMAQLFTRQLEHDKQVALNENGGDYAAKIIISKESRQDIEWWVNNINVPNPIKLDQYDTTIFTDSSTEAWGASCDGIEIGGSWSISERKLHINSLELMAVQNALRYYLSNKTNMSVLLRVDNKTAIAYINKQGGCRSTTLHAVAKEILLWCYERNLNITATYIRSKDNHIADRISRGTLYNSEWCLTSKYFDRIVTTFGMPEIDLFASELNSKCTKFYSLFPERGSVGVDAFTCVWDGNVAYAFPPFSLLPRVLQKIKISRAKVILVAPNWPGQPWFPVYHSLRKSNILRLGPDKSLLMCPISRKSHPLKTLELMAAILCGQHSGEKD